MQRAYPIRNWLIDSPDQRPFHTEDFIMDEPDHLDADEFHDLTGLNFGSLSDDVTRSAL